MSSVGPEPLPEPLPPDGAAEPAYDVGSFDQGTAFSRWALARYLVGRAVAESVSWTLLVVVAGLVALAVVVQVWAGLTALTVVLAVVAVFVLALRTVLRAVLRRLGRIDHAGAADARLRTLVSDTRRDVLHELRRLGLPSHRLTLPLLGFRLVGRRRADTLARLRGFDTEAAVPRARLDELHLMIQGMIRAGRLADGTVR